jgi:FMN phosphatase YigB (HAD superfamily)
VSELRYLLLDLDGVIRHYPPQRNIEIEQKYNLNEGTLLSAAFEKSLLSKAVCGLISDEDWRVEIVNNVSKDYPRNIAASAVAEWSDFPGLVDDEFLKYVNTKFASLPIAILTNGTSRLHMDLSKINLKDKFFKIFNSAEIGFCKPDKRIFIHVLTDLRCQPSEVLFIDDSQSHIQAAQELGLRTHQYRSLDVFRSACETAHD